MNFDVRTATVLMASVSVVMAFCLAMAQRHSPIEIARAMRLWARGVFAIGVAMIFFSARGVMPDWLTVLVANVFFMAGQGDVLRAIWQFGGLKDRPYLAYAAAMIVPFVQYYLHWVVQDLSLRIMTFSLFAAFMSGWQFIAALKIHPERAHTGKRIVASVFLLACLLLLLRAISLIGEHQQVENLFVATPVQIIIVAFGVMAQSVSTLGFVLMCHDRLVEGMAHLARIDPLTGLANRRAAIESLNHWFEDQPERDTLAVLLIDADHFKNINDTHGHAVGDQALQSIATAIRESFPQSAVTARWGGEEFLVAVRDCSNAQMQAAAENLRRSIERLHEQSRGALPKLAVSIGAVTCPKTRPHNMESVLHEADLALYRAKENGRNRVEIGNLLG